MHFVQVKKEAETVAKLTSQNEELSAKLTQMENDKTSWSEQLKETQTKLDDKSTELTEAQETLKVLYVCAFDDVFFVCGIFVLYLLLYWKMSDFASHM